MNRRVIFIIIGVILVTGFIGATYLLRSHNDLIGRQLQQNTISAKKSEVSSRVNAGSQAKSQEVADSAAHSSLPQSGSELNIVKIGGASCLVVAFAYYWQSRRKPFDL